MARRSELIEKTGLGAGKVNAPGVDEPGESITECAKGGERRGRHRHRVSGAGGDVQPVC